MITVSITYTTSFIIEVKKSVKCKNTVGEANQISFHPGSHEIHAELHIFNEVFILLLAD